MLEVEVVDIDIFNEFFELFSFFEDLFKIVEVGFEGEYGDMLLDMEYFWGV